MVSAVTRVAKNAIQKSLDAYSIAVSLKPKDGLWHVGYAEMIWENMVWCESETLSSTGTSESEKQTFAKEMKAALTLVPDDEHLQELDLWVKDSDPTFYNDYISPFPTATPSPNYYSRSTVKEWTPSKKTATPLHTNVRTTTEMMENQPVSPVPSITDIPDLVLAATNTQVITAQNSTSNQSNKSSKVFGAILVALALGMALFVISLILIKKQQVH